MDDLHIRGWTVASWVLWTAAAAIVLTAFGLRDANLGDIGIVVAAGAATVTVKGFLVRQRRMIVGAFRMGLRDGGRGDPQVRSMR